MATPDTIQDGKVVLIHYTLKNDSGEVLDSSSGRDPLPYLHGAGNIVPGLEKELAGCNAGDKLQVEVQPAEAYGERQGPAPQAVPMSAFPGDVQVRPGMQFATRGPQGEVIPLWVDRVEGDEVYVDHNHPLAGHTLHFAVEVVRVREPTQQELEHGHPHGPEGTESH